MTLRCTDRFHSGWSEDRFRIPILLSTVYGGFCRIPFIPEWVALTPGDRLHVAPAADAFDQLVDAADEADDRRELNAAREEDDYIPWAEVKADLGLE